MKVEDSALGYIQRVIKVANLVKIGNISVESGKIRGMDDEQKVFIFHTENVPEFEFGSIGINRLDEFTNRLNIARATTNFSIDATVESNSGSAFARALHMKGKGLKADYRCANPMTIMAPKTIKAPFFYKFDRTDDFASFLQQGQTAFKCENVSLVGSEDGVVMEMSDVNNDKMEYTISDMVEIVDGDNSPSSVSFKHNYPVKMLLPLVKASDNNTIYINGAGILRLRVQGFDMHVWAVQ